METPKTTSDKMGESVLDYIMRSMDKPKGGECPDCKTITDKHHFLCSLDKGKS